ncbi:hypothetical protein [Geminisphaera colitermitum]|uniref:hypothetical protein n=1 Tax=Geminisphaera colitermitum TaxID=1148786 RepID=UPI0005BC15D1|nr:hypothetical protein [Geminisphaera colitermitum]
MILQRLATTTLTTITTLALALLLASGTGCRDREIITYTIPKPPPPPPPATASDTDAPTMPPPAGGTMAGTPVVTADGVALVWTAPAHWQERPASAMRKATYIIPARSGGLADAASSTTATAELAVTAFPGDVGGNLANVNRWRQQLQLPPLTADALPQALRHLDVGAFHIDVVELLGPDAADNTAQRQRVLGAIVPVGDATWFFKLTGPDATVAAERETFDAFLQTLRPGN